ncbi:GNAT family N-acetyltransferase [Micromonospora sp. WMMD1102]|uniref:GNAT family N-acetyltransferase n=1 Tax=Micromonospora sp. WMMD1102 TaxID=3016105 RepID=UPI0024157571|nr:GNAT family N-acetyltransferase [Micromonospora sp. WMMD1102]MDG4786319.1 GNAT family N-acetyltransferase [Micromonospora sp. WMMD1102]
MIRTSRDRNELADLLRRDPHLHAYELGDLDDFYWPYTNWYRCGDAVALLYHGAPRPVLLALHRSPAVLAELLTGLLPLLPRHFEAHLSPGGVEVLARDYPVRTRGAHLKMALTDPDRLARVAPAGEVLTEADVAELTAFYQAAYPGNWFDPRMVETGHYVGLRRDGGLVAVAGVHVWSPRYRVSALGNVTTAPAYRGQGLGSTVVATLCRRLLETVDTVALNVAAENTAAYKLYDRLGFTPVAEYTEYVVGEEPAPAAVPDDDPQ